MLNLSIKKHTLIFVLFLIFSNVAFPQHIIVLKGKIIDTINSTAVEYASVSINNKPIGTISNSKGVFLLSFYGSKNDSICFSHLNYYKKKIAINALIGIDSLQIQLNEKEFKLDEIIVKTNSVPEIIEKAIINSNKKIKDKLPLSFETYYREFVNENGRYTKFSDGILDYYILGKSNKIKTTVRVNQSRAKEVQTENDDKIDWDLTSPLDVKEVGMFKAISKLKNILCKDNASNYKFKLLSNTSVDGTEIMLVSFEPKPEINQPLYTGNIEIDKKQNLILSFEYELLPNHAEYSKEINLLIIRGKLLNTKVKVLFNAVGNDYYLCYVKREIEMKLWNKKKINETFSFLSDLLVIKVVDKSNIKPISKKESYKKKALYPLGDNYQSDFWKNKNAIQLTSEEEKIINQLK